MARTAPCAWIIDQLRLGHCAAAPGGRRRVLRSDLIYVCSAPNGAAPVPGEPSDARATLTGAPASQQPQAKQQQQAAAAMTAAAQNGVPAKHVNDVFLAR